MNIPGTGISNSNDGDITYNNGVSDCWVLKLEKNGTIKWQKSYGGNGREAANAIHQTKDGGYIMAGHAGSSTSGDIVNYHIVGDYWIVKLKSDGSLKWQKAFGGYKAMMQKALQKLLMVVILLQVPEQKVRKLPVIMVDILITGL